MRSWLKRRLGAGPDAPTAGPRSTPPLPARDGEWTPVCHSRTLDTAGTFAVGDDVVAVFRSDGNLYALDNTCVHEDGPLGEGTVEDGVVTCPYHDWRYELATGTCLTRTDRAVGCFAVRERDGVVWVGRRRTAGSGERGGEHDDGLLTVADPSTPDS